MLDSRTSRWTAATLAGCLVLLAASWFLLVSPRRDQAGQLREQAAGTEAKSDQMRIQLNLLRAQFGDLDKQRAKLVKIQQQLPSAAEMPDLVRNLQTVSGSSGVTLVSVKPGTPSVSKANSSVVEIPMSLSVTGDYFEDVLFLKNLQSSMTRSFLVTGLNVADADAGSSSDSSSSSSGSGSGTGTTPTPAATPVPVVTVTKKSMTVSGSIFVLLDGATSLGTVAQQAQQAAAGTTTSTGSGATAS